MRRILLIVVAALVFIGLVVALFFLFVAPKAATPGTRPGTFPGSGNQTIGTTTPPEVGQPVSGAGNQIAPKLFKITDGPVALGTVSVDALIPAPTPVTDGTTTAPTLPPTEDVEVRYVERASGNIYQYRMGERTLTRLTKQTLPGIQRASWTSDGARAFVSYISKNSGIENIETYSLPADGGDGYFLQQGLSDVVVTGTSTVLSVLPSTSGTIGTAATPSGANAKTAFTSLLSSLRVFAAGKSYAAVTKPSLELLGYAFQVSAGGDFTRLAGPLNGLMITPSPSGTKFIYSSFSGSTLATSILDSVTGAAQPLPINTLAEKCAWSADSQVVYCAVPRALPEGLPDSWYQGTVHTSDRIWKIDLSSRVASLVFDPTLLAKVDIDAVALTLDAKEKSLTFTDKTTGSLWLFEF